MFEKLETNRLYLRPLTFDDYDFFFELLNSENWLTYIGNRNINSFEDAKNYIHKIISNPKYNCSIFVNKQTSQPLGTITFIYRDNQEFPDIGYAMLPKFEKNGYAFEAVKAYFDYVINQKITKKIIAITTSNNKNSISLLDKLGMKFEKTFFDTDEEFLLYSVDVAIKE